MTVMIQNLVGYRVRVLAEDGTMIEIRPSTDAMVASVGCKELVPFSDVGQGVQRMNVHTNIEIAGASIRVAVGGRTVPVICGLPMRGDVIVSSEVCDAMVRLGKRHNGRVFCPRKEQSNAFGACEGIGEGLVYRDDVSVDETSSDSAS
jgi:hypothetical protein